MSRPPVAIVGSGIAGAAIAHALAARGHEVVVFEQGPETPYPPVPQFREAALYSWDNPERAGAEDIARMTVGGRCGPHLAHDRAVVVGGSATLWFGITLRMSPRDFRTRTLYGIAEDWPIGYEDLEPWYGDAESLLGVSGTDADNPFAPPRSRPYPLPPFELTWDDRLMAERLGRRGIRLHTTPQARTRIPWDGRPACVNRGGCRFCPSGARYSPVHHLNQARATGRCTLRSGVVVRRILLDSAGRTCGLAIREPGASADREHRADVIVVAAGAFESARLLLLSAGPRHPDGLGNRGGHVGRHLMVHHVWGGHLHYRERLYAGRAGFPTGQSHQFCDPPGRGRHGGVKIEFGSRPDESHARDAGAAADAAEALKCFEPTRRCRAVALHAESVPAPGKHVRLSDERDAFGDRCAHVQYDLADFDHRTWRWARGLFDRIVAATGATDGEFGPADRFRTFSHHMGTCRMGRSAADGVVDSLGRVHGVPGLFLSGLGTFPSPAGAVNPTLTAVALALRSADAIAERLGPAS